jgi:hypothetical protein
VDVIPTIFVFTELRRCRLLPLKFAKLVVGSVELNPFSATHQSQADRLVFFSVLKDSSVVICTRWSEAFNGLVLQLGSFTIGCDSGTNSNRKVGAQTKQRTNVLISQGLYRVFIGQFCVNFLVRIMTSVSKSLKRFVNFDGLLGGRLKLANYSKSLFHFMIVLPCELFAMNKILRAAKAKQCLRGKLPPQNMRANSLFLPALKRRGFQAQESA